MRDIQISTRMSTSGNKLDGYELYDLVDVSCGRGVRELGMNMKKVCGHVSWLLCAVGR